MELNELYTVDAHESGAEMQIKAPDGTPVECFLTVIGLDSPTWATIQRGYREKQMKALTNGDKENVRAAMIAEAIKGWRGFTSVGDDVEFSTDKVKELFIKAPYILQQADEFIVERRNFMKG